MGNYGRETDDCGNFVRVDRLKFYRVQNHGEEDRDAMHGVSLTLVKNEQILQTRFLLNT